MSSESDGSGRSDDIVVIKQLLLKLEEAAAREAETPREEPRGAEQPADAIVTEPVNQEPPLLVLRSSRGMALVTPSPAADREPSLAQAMPEFSLSPNSIDLPPRNETALATVAQQAPPARSRPAMALAVLSFALGIVAAGALIIVVDPFGQRDGGARLTRAPSPGTLSTIVSREASPKPAEPSSGKSTAETARSSNETAPAVVAADAAASLTPPGAGPGVDAAMPEPPRHEAARAPVSAGDRTGLRVASRIELKAGERRVFDVQVDAPPGEAQRLLVVFRQVPVWMKFSKGGAIGNDIWLLPAQQVGDLEVEVSDGASGTADVNVQLAKVDGSILSETSVSIVAASPAYAPAATSVAPTGGNEATILRLQARGELLLDTGEVEAARTLLRTAAEAGSVAAALRLAETYDPAEIQRLGMADRSADLGQAVRWYEHAQALGSPIAAARLVALGRR